MTKPTPATTKAVKSSSSDAHPSDKIAASAKPAASAKKAGAKVGAAASETPAEVALAPSPGSSPNALAAARAPSKKSLSPDNMPSPATKVDTKLANAWKQKTGRELSESELLAMPDTEYMSEKQLDFFRHCLEQQKDDLLSNAGETTEHLREDTSIVPDPADRATIEEEHALELRTRDRERKLLKKISQALARIESGEYGFCDETGEPIGLARLLARPTATLSLEAQQRRELKQKMFGD